MIHTSVSDIPPNTNKVKESSHLLTQEDDLEAVERGS